MNGEEFALLVERYLDGVLSAEERRALVAAVQAAPQWRQAYCITPAALRPGVCAMVIGSMSNATAKLWRWRSCMKMPENPRPPH